MRPYRLGPAVRYPVNGPVQGLPSCVDDMRGGDKLSLRLEALLSLVPSGGTVADIGTDHGYLAIALMKREIAARVIAMDVRRGPLSRAGKNIREAGYHAETADGQADETPVFGSPAIRGETIALRLSDGFSALGDGEAQSAVLAGMGGRLMQRLIREGKPVSRGISVLILQPQSEIAEFRAFLRENGWKIEDERAVCEDGKYYPMCRAVYCGRSRAAGADENARETARAVWASQMAPVCGDAETAFRLADRFGPLLLSGRNEVLRQELYREYRKTETLIRELSSRSGGAAGLDMRIAALTAARGDMEAAIRYIEEQPAAAGLTGEAGSRRGDGSYEAE